MPLTHPGSARRTAAVALLPLILAGLLTASPAHASGSSIAITPDDIGTVVGDTSTPWSRANGTNLAGRYEIVDDPTDGFVLELETVGGAVGVGTQSKFMHYFGSSAYPSVDGTASLVGADPVASVALTDLLAGPVSATYRGATYLTLQIEVLYGDGKFFTLYQKGDASGSWTTFSTDPAKLWTISGTLTDIGGTTIRVCGAAGTRACGNGEDVKLDNLLAGLADQAPRAIAVGVNKGRDTNAANAGLVQVKDITFAGQTFVFDIPVVPAAPVAPPAADSAELDRYISDNAVDVAAESDQFVTTGTVNTDLSRVTNTEPLNGRYENWTDPTDAFADVYSYSTAVHLGTFPIVGGHVVLTGADISHLQPGRHHLLFIGQTSGAVRIVALTVFGLAVTGAEPSPVAVALAGFAVLAGAGMLVARAALSSRRARTGRRALRRPIR